LTAETNKQKLNPKTMKRNLLLLGVVALLTLPACRKTDRTTDRDLNPARDMSAIDNSFEEIYTMIDKVARAEPGLRDYGFPECVNVVVDTVSNPKSIVIDFGATNCLFPSGLNRRGVIEVAFTGRYRDEGTVITIILQNYFVNDHKLEGTKTVTNLGYNDVGNLTFSVEISGAQLTAPDNSWTSSWHSSRVREWIQGEGTIWNPFDDVYSITGSGYGVTRNGQNYTAEILSPLIVKIGCRWIVQGNIEVMRPGAANFTVEFGNGNCDNVAVVNIFGNDYTIFLN
jgi:hypothetical protein